jgi:hypothetical protein
MVVVWAVSMVGWVGSTVAVWANFTGRWRASVSSMGTTSVIVTSSPTGSTTVASSVPDSLSVDGAGETTAAMFGRLTDINGSVSDALS